jgi:aldehyde dehydrogenase (NAD+)
VHISSFVDGEWVAKSGELQLDTNPARPAEVVATYALAGAGELEHALVAASRAFGTWRSTPLQERAAVLSRAAALLEERAGEIAVELTREQGKTLAESHGELRRTSEILRFNASLATAAQGELYGSPRRGEQIWTTRVPLGPTAIITPWNVPIAIPTWKIAPALLYGNTIIWKPSMLVPLLAYRLMQALADAGLPDGVCNLLLMDSALGEKLMTDKRIRACSFTGSTKVGRRLVELGAQNGVKVQAEMGGKNAAIVLEDADLEWAVDQVLSGAMYSTGQRCTATSRALVSRACVDEFTEKLLQRVSKLRVGDPLDKHTEIGPLASAEQKRSVLHYFELGNTKGSAVLIGGSAIETESGGHYVAATVVSGATVGHPVFDEEVFGPMLAVVPIDSVDEAIELANHGSYGLSAAIFSRNIERILGAIDKLDVGVVHVNSETCGADPHVPFGGVKESGTAHREMGTAARDFYTEMKTVYLRGNRLM